MTENIPEKGFTVKIAAVEAVPVRKNAPRSQMLVQAEETLLQEVITAQVVPAPPLAAQCQEEQAAAEHQQRLRLQRRHQ